MAHGRIRSRAAVALDEAPTSLCPHCGRVSKTVQGVCADCWGVKDPESALDLRPPPRTEPLLGLGTDLDDLIVQPWLLVGIVLAILGLIGLVFGVR